jgi:hypothetical protein
LNVSVAGHQDVDLGLGAIGCRADEIGERRIEAGSWKLEAGN